MIEYAEAKALIDELEPEYAKRHNDCQLLRRFWHGDYEHGTKAGLYDELFTSLVKDGAERGTVTDYNLVRNLVFDVCLKYQSFLSPLPMIRTFVERESRPARKQAALKERVLYGTWADGNMNVQLNRIAWFGPLMGDAFLGAWPDMERNIIRPVVRSPEHAFPVPNFDGTRLDALLFCWKTTPAKAKRAFPNWDGQGPDGEQNAEIEVLEYSDNKGFKRWVDTKLTNHVEHNLGFNLFDQVPFIRVPGEPFNHGAVEQAVNLVIAGSALHSLVMQAMIENVFPRMVLEDPMKFSETIDTGPGAVIAVNAGGDIRFVSPGTETLATATGIIQENERAIKQGTSMPDVNFGQFDASIITGKAVNALQGAGTGSVVEMVQGGGIGGALTSFNEKVLTMYQRMFRDDQIHLYGVQPQSMLDLNPRQFALSFKGSEIVGSPRNEVVFSPYIDLHGKLVMALQAQGAGLVSKTWSREQIGISDSEIMQEEIVGEVIEEAVVGAMMQALQAAATPEAGDEALAAATAYIGGGEPVLRAPLAPPGPAPAPPGGSAFPGAPADLPGGGQAVAPPFELPPGSPQAGAPFGAAPQTAPPGPAPGGAATPTADEGISLEAAQAALAGVDLVGRAWLVGQIVMVGVTNEVEVALTDDADRQTIADALRVPVVFHRVTGPPAEEAVEVGA